MALHLLLLLFILPSQLLLTLSLLPLSSLLLLKITPICHTDAITYLCQDHQNHATTTTSLPPLPKTKTSTIRGVHVSGLVCCIFQLNLTSSSWEILNLTQPMTNLKTNPIHADWVGFGWIGPLSWIILLDLGVLLEVTYKLCFAYFATVTSPKNI